MGKKVKNIIKQKKPKKSAMNSIAELKEKLENQKDALNKIIKNIMDEKELNE